MQRELVSYPRSQNPKIIAGDFNTLTMERKTWVYVLREAITELNLVLASTEDAPNLQWSELG